MFSARRSWNACSIGKRRDPVTRTLRLFPPETSLAAGSRRRTALVPGAILFAAIVCIILANGALAAANQAVPAQEPAAAPASEHAATTPAAEHAAAPAGESASQGEPARVAEGHGAQEAEGHGGEGEQAESPWAWIARIVNFGILAGGLFYLLRSPLVGFLEQRGVAVRSELAKAAELKKDASAQIAQIDAKMAALPSEIETLKRRGAEEIAAEEARIHSLAEAERKRLLEQARREIEAQLRIAERDLKKRAGELAVAVATERVKRTITAQDHARLVDRYVAQVRH